MHEPWGLAWYYFFGIFAGELLLFFISGIPVSMIGLAGEPHFCKKCNGRVLLSGRYFKFESKPWRQDYALFLTHGALNVVIWIYLKDLLLA